MRGKGKGRRRKAEKRELGERGSEGGNVGRKGEMWEEETEVWSKVSNWKTQELNHAITLHSPPSLKQRSTFQIHAPPYIIMRGNFTLKKK